MQEAKRIQPESDLMKLFRQLTCAAGKTIHGKNQLDMSIPEKDLRQILKRAENFLKKK